LFEIICLSFALNESIVVWIIYVWESFFIQNFRKAIAFTLVICDSLYLARRLRTRDARTIFLRRHVWDIQFISEFTICNHENSRIISISFMLISINSFLSLWMWLSEFEILKRTLCVWYVRNDVSSRIFSSFFNDNSSWKLNFLILNWFTKFSITSKSIKTRKLCLCESTSIYTSMKMWLTTSFFSIRACKTKTMFTNFDLFSHIWDQSCWVKSNNLIVHDSACHNYNKWFRFCVYSTTIFYDEERSRNVRRSYVIFV
jgi:hypothetical protein